VLGLGALFGVKMERIGRRSVEPIPEKTLMRVPTAVYIVLGVAVSLVVSVSSSVSAQVPRPRAGDPAPRAVIEPAAPAPAEAPAAQAPGQPTAAPTAAAPTEPAPAEPAPVSAAPPPSGVTQLPPPAPPPATSSSSAAATAAGKGRTYSAANFSLSLDGINVGPLAAVEGGAVAAEVVVENAGPDNIRKKHVAGVKYEELAFDVGLGAKPVIEWITSTWQGKQPRKSGSVQMADFSYNVRGERQFANALITGTTIPTLDGSSKETGYLTVTIAPESVREMGGSGAKAATNKSDRQKMWLRSNFSFELGDLPGKRVARIESFTVGQKVTEDQVGEFRDLEKQPGTLVFPDLKVTLSQADAEPWAKWHEEFVIKGNNGDAQEKNGAIVFLSPNMKDELGRINLFNCGIFRFGTPRLEANANRVALVTADLYCERMELVAK
jgi:tail tube protein gp19